MRVIVLLGLLFALLPTCVFSQQGSSKLMLFDYYSANVIEGDVLKVFVIKDNTLKAPFAVYEESDASIVVSPSEDIDIGVAGNHSLSFTVKNADEAVLEQRVLSVLVEVSTLPFMFFDAYKNEQKTKLVNEIVIALGTSISDSFYTIDVFAFYPNGDDASQFVSVDASPVDVNVVGTYSINYTLDIPNHTPITQSRTIRVADEIPPVISFNFPDELDYVVIERRRVYVVEAGMSLPMFNVTVTDGHDPNAEIVGTSYSPSIFETSTLLESGTIASITYEARDSSANFITKSVMFKIVDQTPPIVLLNGNASVLAEAGVEYVDAGATASDVLESALGRTLVPAIATSTVTNLPESLERDVFVIIYTACDAANNCGFSPPRNIMFQDTTPPSFSRRDMQDEDLSITIGNKKDKDALSAVFHSDIVVSDLYYSLDLINVKIDDSHVIYSQDPSNLPTTTFITVTATDGSGNYATVNVSVLIAADGVRPVLTLEGNDMVSIYSRSASWEEPGFGALDDVDGDITKNVTTSISIVDPQPTPSSVLGSYSQQPLCMFSSVVEATAVTSSPQSFQVPSSEHIDSVNAYHGLSYLISYSVQDNSGNFAFANRFVSFEDRSRPLISLADSEKLNLEVITKEVHTSFTDKGATAESSFDGDITAYTCAYVRIDEGAGYLDLADAENRGSTVLSRLVLAGGSYTPISIEDMNMAISNREYVVGSVLIISYSVISRSGHEAIEKSRAYVLVDTTPPQLRLDGDGVVGDVEGKDVFVVPFGTVYREPGVSALDNYDGDLSTSVQVEGINDIDTHSPGAYNILYSVSDEHGNTATAQRRVRVDPNTFPPNNYILVLSVTGTLQNIYRGGNDESVEGDLRQFLDSPFVVLFSVTLRTTTHSANGDGSADGSNSGLTPTIDILLGVRNETTLDWDSPDAYAAQLMQSAGDESAVIFGGSSSSNNVIIVAARILGDSTTTVAPSTSRGAGVVGIAIACAILVVIVVLLIYFVLKNRKSPTQNRGSLLLEEDRKRGQHQHELTTVGGVRYVIDDSSDSDDDIPEITPDERKREALSHNVSDTNFVLYNNTSAFAEAEERKKQQQQKQQEPKVVKYGWDKSKHGKRGDDEDNESEQGEDNKWMDVLNTDPVNSSSTA
eukprot:m.3879 g.3879  ORF g.3879 m.3879 type:complete len:1138 (+) comp3757_c0_seq2:125-3538(+)